MGFKAQSSKPIEFSMEFSLPGATAILERTPRTLVAMLDGLDEPWVRGTEGPDTFSPFDVVGHLIDGEETDWMPRARIILARSTNPRFDVYDRFRHRERNAGRTLTSLLEEFARLRAENLQLLRSWNLSEGDLDQPGIHGHVAQVARVMAKQYKEEVGPWVPFMPVLTDHERPRS
jgi:hypothetical protein